MIRYKKYITFNIQRLIFTRNKLVTCYMSNLADDMHIAELPMLFFLLVEF